MTKIINGLEVPYNLETNELLVMLEKTDMSSFVAICEALSYRDTEDVCDALGYYLLSNDKYRRLCVLKIIFRNSYSIKWMTELEKAIQSDDFIFVDNGLKVVADYNIKVSEKLIVSAIKKHFQEIKHSLLALSLLEISDDNFKILINFFMNSNTCLKQEILAEILVQKYLVEKSNVLFGLFAVSKFGKIRKLAVQIGFNSGYDISAFKNDPDGHVRDLINKVCH
jgi:hypothetical protein